MTKPGRPTRWREPANAGREPYESVFGSGSAWFIVTAFIGSRRHLDESADYHMPN
jgi:hypothetical protein